MVDLIIHNDIDDDHEQKGHIMIHNHPFANQKGNKKGRSDNTIPLLIKKSQYNRKM
jgi:hypothetical protein